MPKEERTSESKSRLIRLREVQSRVGLGRSTIYRWMSEGTFPKPVSLGGNVVAWIERDVEAWIESRIEASSYEDAST